MTQRMKIAYNYFSCFRSKYGSLRTFSLSILLFNLCCMYVLPKIETIPYSKVWLATLEGMHSIVCEPQRCWTINFYLYRSWTLHTAWTLDPALIGIQHTFSIQSTHRPLYVRECECVDINSDRAQYFRCVRKTKETVSEAVVSYSQNTDVRSRFEIRSRVGDLCSDEKIHIF